MSQFITLHNAKCRDCLVKLVPLVYRPRIEGENKYFRAGVICPQCKKYLIEIQDESSL